MKFSIGYFAKPRAPGIPPALLATYTGDFNTVDDARKAAIADVDNPKIGAVDSITRMGTQTRARMNGPLTL
jgi:hypothetical protein